MILLNTTTRPVGYDYARVLFESDHLAKFVSAFPRRKSKDLGDGLLTRTVFCDRWQTVFLFANRFGGSTGISRSLSHRAKASLDRGTARQLDGCDAAIFYSGAGLETIRACRKKGILSVCQVHHTHVVEQERILRAEAAVCGLAYTPIYSPAQVCYQLQEFDEADLILCPSGSVRESFERARIPPEKLVVVAHGVELTEGAHGGRREVEKRDPLRVLYVGQLHYRKGLRYLAAAMAGFSADDAVCRLVGPDFGLSGLSKEPESAQWIKTGSKKGEPLWQEYREADVFVLPSVEEGFGLVVLEAMRAGLPVIITSAVGAKDFVTDGVEGWIVPPGDSTALLEKIRWMADHPEERRRMGAAAAQRATAAGGWAASAQRLVEAINGKIKRTGNSRRIE